MSPLRGPSPATAGRPISTVPHVSSTVRHQPPGISSAPGPFVSFNELLDRPTERCLCRAGGMRMGWPAMRGGAVSGQRERGSNAVRSAPDDRELVDHPGTDMRNH